MNIDKNKLIEQMKIWSNIQINDNNYEQIKALLIKNHIIKTYDEMYKEDESHLRSNLNIYGDKYIDKDGSLDIDLFLMNDNDIEIISPNNEEKIVFFCHYQNIIDEDIC